MEDITYETLLRECDILLLFEKQEDINTSTGGNCTCLELRSENSKHLSHALYATWFWLPNRGLRGIQKTAETEKIGFSCRKKIMLIKSREKNHDIREQHCCPEACILIYAIWRNNKYYTTL